MTGHVRRRRLAGSLQEDGFTLVELLIAAALSILLTAAVFQIFDIASTINSASAKREELLGNATVGFRRLADMLSNSEMVSDKISSDVNDAVFFIERRKIEGRFSDGIALKTRSFQGIDELSSIFNEKPRNVIIYVRYPSGKATGELVAHGFLDTAVPKKLADIDKNATAQIEVLAQGVSEFRVEYLDLEAKTTASGTGLRLTPELGDGGKDGRSFKAGGSSLPTEWHGSGKSLHDVYNGLEITTPRLLRITLILESEDGSERQEFPLHLLVTSSQTVKLIKDD